jgi:hypothetical protein
MADSYPPRLHMAFGTQILNLHTRTGRPLQATCHPASCCWCVYSNLMPASLRLHHATHVNLSIYICLCMYVLFVYTYIYIHVYVYIVIIIYSQACACLNYVHTQYIYNYILIPKTLLNDSTKPSWNDLTCLPSSPDSLSRSIFWQCCKIQNLQMTTSAQFQHCVKALHLGFTD